MKKSVLIIGIGRLGGHLAEKMQDLGHDVIALDSKEESINKIAGHFDDARIADYTNEDVLRALDIPSFDLCFITVGDDFEASMITTLLLKKLGAKYVAARARDDIQCELLKKVGADEIIYADGEVAASSSALPPESDGIITNGSLAYSIRSDGMLSVTDMADFAEGLPEGRYSSLKLAGGKVYALLDGGLCAIEGSEIDDISVVRFTFRYTDVSQEHTIAVGDSAALLKAGTAVCRATVPAGQYVTAIDLSRLDGQYFIVDEDASPSTRPAETDTEALVLCTTGNADIIAIGNDTYITRSLGEKTEYGLSAPPFENAQLNYPAGMYSMPCMNEATQLLRLEPGEKVKVEGMISAVEGGALIADFCKVTYTADDGTSVTGYIAEDFLTVYNFTGEDGQFSDPTPPDDYSEDDVVLTVVLVIVIVVLVIACVAYLAYASGANRRQKRQEPEDEDTMN